MFLKVLKHEFKQATRDRMYVFFIFFEVVLISTSSLLLPYLERSVSQTVSTLALIVLLLMTGIIFGAISGFSMLDDQDDGVLFSLKITPISMNTYIILKLFIAFIFSFIGTFALFLIMDLISFEFLLVNMMTILLASLQAPFIALVMSSFAQNKVEGFVIMKLTGLTLIGPIVSLFIFDYKEFFLSIFPGFWPARLLLMQTTSLSFTFTSSEIYFVLGLCVNLLIMYALFKVFQKRKLM